MGHVFYRRTSHHILDAERGEGVYIWDTSGRRYLDASGGPACVNVGHGVRSVVESMAEQAGRIAYAHATDFTTDVVETYSDRLAEIVPLRQPRFFYLTSGSEAVEAALKFARQVQLGHGGRARALTISRWGSYHGATLGALAVTGKPAMRELFGPLFCDQPHIPAPYCYRCPYSATYPACNLECAGALEAEILHQGPDRVIAFIAEPIGGSALGAIVPPDEYWTRIAETCRRYGLLLIVDEVLCGFGRTGAWFGIDHFDVKPDVMVMAKGAAGGYVPFSILAVERDAVARIYRAHGGFVHGGTFSHHAVGASAALATLDYIQENALVAAVRTRGTYLGQRLADALGELPCVGDIRGLGLLWAVEFVENREAKTPFRVALGFCERVCSLSADRGVLLYPRSGCADGVTGDHVMVSPPFVIEESQIDEIVDTLREAVLDVWEQVR
jgi:adenosylmethionine-8-amino-7-oxononanoate aminotransferase